MTTLTETIGTQFFQLSTVGAGALAVGVEDVRQCIDIILRSIPGSDPMRPLFGCNAFKYVDKPIDVAVPNVKKEIYEALSLWEPRIEVTSITHQLINTSQLDFTITYRIIDDNILDSINYSSGGIVTASGSNSGNIIISAPIPVKIDNGVYRVSFFVNDKAVQPEIPQSGFISSSEMLVWINGHWANYGRWFVTDGALILYLNSGLATKATLIVTQTRQITLRVMIPELQPGQSYSVGFSPDGNSPTPFFPNEAIANLEDLIAWLNDSWEAYGRWVITTQAAQYSQGDFSNDFAGDFDNGNAVVTDKYLVFISDSLNSATLKFN
jgi:phage baseplate assembly protein W